jgi:hypothetical protein
MNKGISNFKNVFDLYSQIGIVEVCFDIKKIGIYFYTTYDKSIHTMANFSNTSFAEYRCEKECIFTLNIKSMKENLKNITSIDTIELTIKKDCELKIKVIKKTIEFEKKLFLKETQFYNLPIVLDQVSPLNIKSLDFLEFCRSINGKYTLTIKTEKLPEITFESEKSKVIIRSDEIVENLIPFEGDFKAEYFPKLKKFTKFNSSLKIYVNPDQPLIFVSNIGTKDKDKITIWIKSLKQIEEDYAEEQTEN